jgi:diguanylate cyclase (GGDEF)-like protein/PAS domain S-box-containing protein
VIDNRSLEGNFSLAEKKRIALMISHAENRNLLKKYLESEFEIIISDFSQEFEKTDLIITDEKGLKEIKEDVFRIKNSDSSSLYLPVLLITRIAKENIPNKYLEIIDEIIEIPIEKRTFISRIRNLLSIRTMFLTIQIFQKLIDNNPAGICILLEDKEIKYVNHAFLDIIEKKQENIINKNISEVFSADTIKAYFNKRKKEDKDSYTIKLQLANKKKWIEIKSIEAKYKNINLESLILMDITESKKQQEEIEYLSYKDKLTDLYNRRFFEEEMERLDAERQLPISIIMADLNGLKFINDNYGHAKGDELLKKAAEILGSSIREEDVLARQGGDEFAVLLPKTDKNQVKKILKRIRAEIEKTKNEKFPLSIALGAATKKNIEQDIEEVLKKADDNMYKDKLSVKQYNNYPH